MMVGEGRRRRSRSRKYIFAEPAKDVDDHKKERKEMMAKKNSDDDDDDRISELHESILHHIFSYMDMKYVIQTSMLSKKWRYFWKSVPVISFDHSLWKDRLFTSFDLDFIDLINKILERHDSFGITKLNLSCSHFFEIEEINWSKTSLLGLQEVHLEFSSEFAYIYLPDVLFSSSSVKILKVRVQKEALVDLPMSMRSSAATNLKTLHLEGTRFPGDNLDRELLLRFPNLENLILRRCNHTEINVLNIYALQLKILVIENPDDTYWSRSPNLDLGVRFCKLKIYTPRLTSFHYNGFLYKDYSLENLSSLVSANIGSNARRVNSVRPQSLITVLDCVSNVTTLELSISWMEVIQSMMYELPHTFHNLRQLKLTLSISQSSFRVMANLLRCSPNLESLVLEIEYWNISTEVNIGGKLFIESMFNRLKSVEIQNFQGCPTELKFLEIFLTKALVLETITIATGNTKTKIDMPWKKNPKLEEFKEKLHSLPRPSSAKLRFIKFPYSSWIVF